MKNKYFLFFFMSLLLFPMSIFMKAKRDIDSKYNVKSSFCGFKIRERNRFVCFYFCDNGLRFYEWSCYPFGSMRISRKTKDGLEAENRKSKKEYLNRAIEFSQNPSPKIRKLAFKVPIQTLKTLASDKFWEVRCAVAKFPTTPESILILLSQDKNEEVVVATLQNPGIV